MRSRVAFFGFSREKKPGKPVHLGSILMDAANVSGDAGIVMASGPIYNGCKPFPLRVQAPLGHSAGFGKRQFAAIGHTPAPSPVSPPGKRARYVLEIGRAPR